MFVITLVPSSDARGNIGKSLETFHYLGGGDFTGRVFCSTLEGEFVKAFGYTDGRLSGRLLVMKRTELARHAGEGQYDHYSTIRLAEGMKTRSGTYLFDEGGGAGSGLLSSRLPRGPVSALWLQRRGSRCCLSGLRCDKRLFLSAVFLLRSEREVL